MSKSDYILEMRNITKQFPGVKALDNVTVKVKPAEVHCLCGENGAGKSTLMKLLSGVYPYGSYDGDIVVKDEIRQFKNISDSKKVGIAIIYQELALVPQMTIYENIFLGQEERKGLTLDVNAQIKRATELMEVVGLTENVSTKVGDLGIGKQQLVEIAKALNKDIDILILDEPTAALNEDDSANLLELIKKLRSQGVTCILISHKLKEVTYVADVITVIRDGKSICSLEGSDINEANIINNMVGREIENIYPHRENKNFGDVVLEVKNLTAYDKNLNREILKDVSFNVRAGEIIGISGLMGAGRTELAHSIFGNVKKYKLNGDIIVEGKTTNFKSPKDAINAGIAYVSEDRKGDGLILSQVIRENVSSAALEKLVERGVVNLNKEINVAEDYKKSIGIKAPSIQQKVGNLSGGNQQKVSLAKWLYSDPKVLILDEPTRGIDVGAKFEIYTLMNKLVEQGMSIIMISSELLEVIGMSDRVYVLVEGEIKGELSGDKITEEDIISVSVKA